MRHMHYALVPNFELHTVYSGAEALQWLSTQPSLTDLVVLLDLYMPGLTGLDVLRAIRADPKLRPVPLIILTGAIEDTLDKLWPEHRARYLPKPMDMADFKALFETVDSMWPILQTTP